MEWLGRRFAGLFVNTQLKELIGLRRANAQSSPLRRESIVSFVVPNERISDALFGRDIPDIWTSIAATVVVGCGEGLEPLVEVGGLRSTGRSDVRTRGFPGLGRRLGNVKHRSGSRLGSQGSGRNGRAGKRVPHNTSKLH